ncbi:GAF domain-containing protein [Conexibacter sp. SYSU D00693]|uniref:GAF domain-containing protein n=1 Tax=Conexibacter sp. SYSU D00693 TaxID=2812560 RepID=UPI00196AAB6C|nr:GAF domain-containing protein [Conexibacter sp. SYSU D00693]
MAMHVTTVRFSDELWEQLEREAAREGVSVAQFVRDAALLRVATMAGRRGDDEVMTSVQELAARAPRRAVADVARDQERLTALRSSGLLDAGPAPQFDRIAELVRQVLNVPVALVSLVEHDRQYFCALPGLPEPWASARETPLSHSFCQHVVMRRAPLVVPDAREEPLVQDNLAIPDLGVIAYLGVPIVTHDGHALGSLCAIDDKPRHWTADQVELLEALAASVVSEVELVRREAA